MKTPSRTRQNRTPDCPFPVGTRIRAVGHFNRHSYTASAVYTVSTIDTNDQTLQATDPSGEEGNWIRWDDCVKVDDIGWDWLKTKLPADVLDLLSAFDGLHQLRLRNDIRDHLVLQIPELKDKLLTAVEEIELGAAA